MIPSIRIARPGDARALISIARSSGLFEPSEMQAMTGSISAWASGDDGPTWLIEDTEAPGGAAMLAEEPMSDAVWNLLFLGVAPARRRQGTATALIAAAEAAARADGGRLMLVDTAGIDDQAPARACYLAAGYECEATIRDYYGDGVDRVTFRRGL